MTEPSLTRSVSGARETSIAAFVFFFNDTATTEIYTLSLHDALPISICARICLTRPWISLVLPAPSMIVVLDRKSTRLNSSHSQISYAVFCLKKKKTIRYNRWAHTSCSVVAYHRRYILAQHNRTGPAY